MTITATISPDPIQFGNVAGGSTTTVQATVSFDAALPAAATVSVSAPFSVTPTTVAANETAVMLTITYAAPASATQDAAVLTISGGGVSRTLSISGMVDQQAALDTAEKYLLLQVPDYGDTTFASPSTATGFSDRVLTSFLRLGKFDMDDEPPAARQLLNLITQVTCATNPVHFDAAGTVQAHASDPNSGSAFQPVKIHDSLAPGFVFADDIRDRPQDWDNSVSGTGTPAIAGVDDPAHALTKVQRFTESGRLYSRGGWRDHSDGNRISTTFGDKVEVIRGNYKMIVMGRQDDTGQAHGWDVGGDHIQDFAAGTMPGASLFLEWVNDKRFQRPKLDKTKAKIPGTDFDGKPIQVYDVERDAQANTVYDQKGVWLLVNTTENVYEYARNAGNFREEVWGDVNETYVGSENPPPDGYAYARNDTEGTEGHDPPHRISGRNYNYPNTDGDRTTPAWNKDAAGVIRSNPHVIEKTWAARIDSHTGSSACPVPHIEEKTWADKVVERTELGLNKDTGVLRQDAMTTVHGGVIDNTRVLGWNIGLMSVAGFNLDITTMGALNIEATIIGGVSIATTISVGANIEITGSAILHLELYGCLGAHIALDAASVTIEGSAGKRLELIAQNGLKLVPDDHELAAAKTEIHKSVTHLAKDIVKLRDKQLELNKESVHLYNGTHWIGQGTYFL